MRASRTAAGRLHVEETARLDEHWDGSESQRPQVATHHPVERTHTDTGHAEEERRHRFAKKVTHWMGEQIATQNAKRVHLFSPAHLLGEMRKLMPPALAAMIADEAHDLGTLHTSEIAKHPAVCAIPAADERYFLDEHLKRD